MTLPQMRNRIPFWQQALKLQDWTITIRWATAKESVECMGLNYFSVEEQESVVAISRKCSPSEREETVVHELLHLLFDGHTPVDPDKYDPLHERALNQTAKALMSLAYKTDPPAPSE